MIRGVDSQLVPQLWPKVWSVLSRAFVYSRGEFTEEKVYNGLKSGHMQLWIDVEDDRLIAAGTTQVLLWPERKVCRIVGFSSEEGEAIQRFVDMVERWARYQQCDELDFGGRKGWLKRGLDFGFKLEHVIMVKSLGEGK